MAGKPQMPREGAPTSEANERVAFVDAAKGICIVLVVMMHSTLGVEKAAGAEGWMHLPVAFAAPFRMPDFFLVSGLFLSVALTRDLRTFLDRRVVHFLYFFVLWSLIQIAFKIWPVQAEEGLAGAAYFAVRALVWDPIGVMWFLPMLALFSLVARLLRTMPAVAVALGVALHLLAPTIAGWVAAAGLFPGMVEVFCRYLVFFVAGWVAAPLAFRLAEGVRHAPVPALGGLALWAALNGAAVVSGWAMLPPVSLVLGLAGAAAILAVAALVTQTENPLGRGLAFLGERSIVIYLAFFLPMAVTRTLMLRFGIGDVGTQALVVTIMACLGPLVLYAVVQRLGLGHFLFVRPAWARLRPPSPPERRPAMAGAVRP